jgi:3-mercaptopyruvate sulfurtransferase SseA
MEELENTLEIDDNIPVLHCKDLTTINKHTLQAVMALFIGTYKKLGIENVTILKSDIMEWKYIEDTIEDLSRNYGTDYLHFDTKGKNEVENTSHLIEILQKVVKIGKKFELYGIRSSRIFHFVKKMHRNNLE